MEICLETTRGAECFLIRSIQEQYVAIHYARQKVSQNEEVACKRHKIKQKNSFVYSKHKLHLFIKMGFSLKGYIKFRPKNIGSD